MIQMIPNRPLSARLARAVTTVEDAQEQLYLVRIHDVARLIRDVFPQARSIVIDARDRYVEPVGVQLHSILASDGAVLWTAKHRVPQTLESYSTIDEYDWDDVVVHIEHELTSGIGAERPQAWWERYDEDRPGSGLFCTRLPSDADVAAVAAVPAHFAAQLHDRNQQLQRRPLAGPELWLARPARYPTMTVGGVHITASIDEIDGVFTVDVGTDDLPAAAPDSQDRTAIDVRLNGTSLTEPAESTDADLH